jgi:hypothetical protein
MNNCWRGLHEFWARVVTGCRYWRSSGVAIHVGACDRSLGGASGLDPPFWLSPGFHGLSLGSRHLHSWSTGRIRCGSTPNHSRPHDSRPASCPDCYGLAYGCLPGHGWKLVALVGGSDRSDRRHRRSVRRLSGSRRTGSNPTGSRFRNRNPRRSDRNRAGTVFGLQILTVASSSEGIGTRQDAPTPSCEYVAP